MQISVHCHLQINMHTAFLISAERYVSVSDQKEMSSGPDSSLFPSSFKPQYRVFPHVLHVSF